MPEPLLMIISLDWSRTNDTRRALIFFDTVTAIPLTFSQLDASLSAPPTPFTSDLTWQNLNVYDYLKHIQYSAVTTLPIWPTK